MPPPTEAAAALMLVGARATELEPLLRVLHCVNPRLGAGAVVAADDARAARTLSSNGASAARGGDAIVTPADRGTGAGDAARGSSGGTLACPDTTVDVTAAGATLTLRPNAAAAAR